MSRQVRITTVAQTSDLTIEFMVHNQRKWVQAYYLYLDSVNLMNVETLAVMRAWIEYDEPGFHHDELMISDERE